ncbi:HNH endonuclease [Pelagibaculum spongiae]|uniref:HNH domain-containing protein n=1 Tax=Pelagibaculum spongiae TaxID=2080658 RepID=A0A2V1H0H4_9GAMM|nr:HNH endonuclease [Pelagibaculum spongiae]PVZ68799.1 hypothetical protein DC094_11110 [Pelagibaculum spongiae]
MGFSEAYDSAHEEIANIERERFLEVFPVSRLEGLTLKEYIVGTGEDTFCNLIEAKTKTWGGIQGSTALKFGIYRQKKDQTLVFSKKFGETDKKAFKKIHSLLIDLIASGASLDFNSIDRNSLCQTVKAKILSLYFPEKYLAICSREHIELFSDALKIEYEYSLSRAQHLLHQKKAASNETNSWSNPKYMAYLYSEYMGREVFTKKARKCIDTLEADSESLLEGGIKTVQVNAYERNIKARRKCLEHHGFSCKVCSIDFEKIYGDLGKGFIHVHHLKEISSQKKEYKIDPVNDLVPVCPNCHSMLHRKTPSLTVNELKNWIKP